MLLQRTDSLAKNRKTTSPTPILDLEKDPRSDRSRRTLLWVITCLVVCVLVLPSKYLPENRVRPHPLLMVPALYLNVSVHELGHLFGGWLVGLRNGGLTIGAFTLARSRDRWKFRFYWKNLFGGGAVAAFGMSGDYRRGAFALTIAAGPLSTLALTAMSYWVWRSAGANFRSWWAAVFWMGVVVASSSLVPYESSGNLSDGKHLWRLATDSARSHSWISLAALQAENRSGVRPRDWDSALFEDMMSDAPADKESSRHLLAYCRRLDEGRGDEALQHLENALASCASSGRIVRYAIFMEAASASAGFRKNAEQAKRWYTRACKIKKPSTAFGTWAAILFCEGKYAEALPYVEAARAFVEKQGFRSGMAVMVLEKLAEFENECHQKIAETTGLRCADARRPEGR